MRVHLKAVYSPLKLCFMRIFLFAFLAIQKLYAQNTNLCFAVFCKFLGGLGDVLEEIVFLKGLVKFREIRKN